MEYSTCPKCNKSVSKKTIEKVGLCNNCVSYKHIEKLKNDNDYLRSKLKNPLNQNNVLEIIDFIIKSDFSNTLKNRVVIDFIKVINELEYGKSISETLLHNIYFQKSAIKSIGILEIIKVFLFSKKLITWDLDQQNFYPKNIKPNSRYEINILDYFYDTSKCTDCGKQLTPMTELNYCYNCIAFRSLFISSSKDFIEENFKSETSKFLYINFMKFLSSLGKTPDTTNDVLRNSIDFINFVEKYIPPQYFVDSGAITKNDNLKVITDTDMYQFNLSENWIEVFNEKFSSNKKRYFLEFLIQIGILSINNRDNFRDKIISKIESLPLKFQKPLHSYLLKEENEIENYKKKNATKDKKWLSVNNKFGEIVNLGKWMVEEHQINSWAEVTDKEINIYLLRFPEKSRVIRKRNFYNFFEFAEKKRWIFNNPIENFVARDFNIEKKPLSKKEHAQIYNSILKYKTDYFIEVFTTSLVYFHALTSKQLISIELNDIDPFSKSISIPKRPRVYLSELEFSLLSQLLISREEKLKGRKNKYLYCSYSSISEKSMDSNMINKQVKKITGMTAKDLRIASLQFCAEEFGVEYLNQCLGMSLTQSSRYGDIQDYYIDEIIADSMDFNK